MIDIDEDVLKNEKKSDKEKIETFNFNNVIDLNSNFTLMNNKNSLAILGDSIQVLKEIKDKTLIF